MLTSISFKQSPQKCEFDFNHSVSFQEEDHYGSESLYASQTKRSKLDEVKDQYNLAAYNAANHRPWSPPVKGGRYPSGAHYSLEHHPPPSSYKLEKFEDEKFSSGYSTPQSTSSGNYNRYKDSPYSVIPKKKYLEEHERFPTLADEISRIKTALDGAPVHAKEAVLKILERLTARVDRAEREKDDAVTRYRELTLKYGQLEDELAKKRGELRELLRQDLKPGGGGGHHHQDATRSSSSDHHLPPHPHPSNHGHRSNNVHHAHHHHHPHHPSSDGGGGGGNSNNMPLKLVKGCTTTTNSNSSKEDTVENGSSEKSSSSSTDPTSTAVEGSTSLTTTTSSNGANNTTALPKITLKSPAKIMMEELNVPSSTRSEAGSVERDEDHQESAASSSNVSTCS